jgi:hypothetical protein
MIKTLLITSIVTAILAVFVFVFLVVNVVFNDHSDEQIREFLNSPGAVEKFNNSAADKTNRNENRSSPLVQQAEAFALYLNPPIQKLSKNTINSQNSKVFKPTLTPVSPKFTVLGTSYCHSNPQISQVFIDEPGKGRHWVRQSDKVGHLLIEQVKDGLVIVKGGEETFELMIEKTIKDTSLPKGGLPTSSKKSIKNRPKLNLPNRNKKDSRDLIEPDEELNEELDDELIEDDEIVELEDRSPEEEAKLEELVNKLRDLDSDDPNADFADKEKAAKMEKLISRFRSSRVSAEEAKRLGNLGEKLKDVQKDPKQSLSIKLKIGQRKSKISSKI